MPPKTFYSHIGLVEAPRKSAGDIPVVLSDEPRPNCADPLRHALSTLRLAVDLGIRLPSRSLGVRLPYSDDNDRLVFDAQLASLVVGRRIRYLRGWKQYESCVKGFNALGLLAEHANLEEGKLVAMPPEERRNLLRAFLRTRTAGSRAVFSEAEVAGLGNDELDRFDLRHLALWRAFARRVIVCSTSSNMGISLHDALRGMQRKRLAAGGKDFSLLNHDEGQLVIWCPDENADFMNVEKTTKLRALEAEKPPLTTLHTYINRKQRDPGALKDALDAGGYFFPTNPQSAEEMQNLLSISLQDVARERNIPFEDLLIDPNIQQTLAGLGADIEGDRVFVRSGVEGGLYGLAVPYLLMLEETLEEDGLRAVSTWNQASIGAALAAIVLADMAMREGLEPRVLAELGELLPRLHQCLRGKRLGGGILTHIHGVFDIANLQSLAQLFGVVVTDHLSGRATAFVGLGSSSYANGNSCFDVLRRSVEVDGAFKGRDFLHPATHTVNPLAQALVYADDVLRVSSEPGFATLSPDEKAERVLRHVRKPEPAGAAAVAGYLLTRLDQGTLSLLEIAYGLRLAGFDQASFLEFAGFGCDDQSANRFTQEASEEGERMWGLAKSLLTWLDREAGDLEREAALERAYSRLKYRWNPIEGDAFEARRPFVNLYLTGDNCAQPGKPFVAAMLARQAAQAEKIQEALDGERRRQAEEGLDPISTVKLAATACTGALSAAQRAIHSVMRGVIEPAMTRMMLPNQPGADVPKPAPSRNGAGSTH